MFSAQGSRKVKRKLAEVSTE